MQGDAMKTRYRHTYRCAVCLDTFNTDEKNRTICAFCAYRQALHVGYGSPHSTLGDDFSIHRIERLIDDDATDNVESFFIEVPDRKTAELQKRF